MYTHIYIPGCLDFNLSRLYMAFVIFRLKVKLLGGVQKTAKSVYIRKCVLLLYQSFGGVGAARKRLAVDPIHLGLHLRKGSERWAVVRSVAW